MFWTIDTGVLGADGCEAKELRGVLEDSMKHHADTAPEAAAREIVKKAPKDADAALVRELGKQGDAAADAIREKLPKVQAQMKAGIDAAETIAAAMGGRVTATVQGHHDPKHPGGIFQRVLVFVDRAAPTGE
jgi:hypothetical protein